MFETDCEVFFAFNGTAANSLALASLCQSYHAVICCQSAHVETDECGAPEFFSNGSKLVVAESIDGKLTPAAIQQIATKRHDIHYPKPRAVTISQSTETGRVYTVEELRALSSVCRKHGLRLHMDGARFANACASLGCSPADLTWRSGVDVLCFGGTKNGMAVGEAILFFNRKLAEDFDYRCKQAGQLASKMRFLAAPWVGMLESGAWLRNAIHANDSARYLADQSVRISRASKSSRRRRPTQYSSTPRMKFSRLCANGAGSFIPLSAAPRALCAPGIRIANASMISAATCGFVRNQRWLPEPEAARRRCLCPSRNQKLVSSPSPGAHISLVFCEMWDATAPSRLTLDSADKLSSQTSVVSHISRTNERRYGAPEGLVKQ